MNGNVRRQGHVESFKDSFRGVLGSVSQPAFGNRGICPAGCSWGSKHATALPIRPLIGAPLSFDLGRSRFEYGVLNVDVVRVSTGMVVASQVQPNHVGLFLVFGPTDRLATIHLLRGSFDAYALGIIK